MRTPRHLPLYLLLCLAQWLLVAPGYGADKTLQPIPPLSGPVIDTTGTLDATQTDQLSQKLRALHDKYGAQLQVLMIASSAPEDAFSYSLRAVEQWKLGTASKDDGVLLFIAKDDRSAQIQVGYGLEGTIPDVVASRLLADLMAPSFRQGDYYGGINAVVDGLYQRIAGEAAPVTGGGTRQRVDQSQQGISIFVVIAVGVIVLKILKSIMGNAMGSVVGAPAIGAGIWYLAGWALPLALGMAFLALLLAAVPNGLWFALLASSGRGRGGSFGGSFGGGGGSRWGGGGGGFGGGGASGRW